MKNFGRLHDVREKYQPTPKRYKRYSPVCHFSSSHDTDKKKDTLGRITAPAVLRCHSELHMARTVRAGNGISTGRTAKELKRKLVLKSVACSRLCSRRVVSLSKEKRDAVRVEQDEQDEQDAPGTPDRVSHAKRVDEDA